MNKPGLLQKSRPPSRAMSTPEARPQLPRAPTGIHGLDEITDGGLPRGRPTLVCGGTGCGKTLLAMEFLARGATEFDEPGVFMAFDKETAEKAKLAQGCEVMGASRKADAKPNKSRRGSK